MSEPPRKSSVASMPASVAGAPNLAGTDFLFHLYRGAELLQDNQVHEAKSEIESALRLQPSEPQGQDLLALVYFRLGLYPMAIQIYESLSTAFPTEIAPRVNLALCYLKTGQPDRAREQLEQVVTLEPERARAWGYLGLAFERLGDYEKAQVAFERGGFRSMARRMGGLCAPADQPAPSVREPGPGPALDLHELRNVAEAAFHELDATDDAFSLALPSQVHSARESGSWFAVEIGHPTVGTRQPRGAAFETPEPAAVEPPVPPSARRSVVGVRDRDVEALMRRHLLVASKESGATCRGDGVVLLTVGHGLGVRMDLVEAMTAAREVVATETIAKRTREGLQDMPLGSPTRPIVSVVGARQVAMRPSPGCRLEVIDFDGQDMYVREERLAAIDLGLTYENGRLASGQGDAISLVHVRGTGMLVLELPDTVAVVESATEAGCLVRCEVVIGWTGRLAPRCLPAGDAPGHMRGWVAFRGDGAVLFDAAAEDAYRAR